MSCKNTSRDRLLIYNYNPIGVSTDDLAQKRSHEVFWMIKSNVGQYQPLQKSTKVQFCVAQI